jgi:hypothetical protein
MKLNNKTIDEFISQLVNERQQSFKKLRETIVSNLPGGFEETISNGMVHYTVPLTTYPVGYHCTDNTPLPFISLASQKNFIALYHMGIYADKSLLDWFVSEYPKHCKYKLDMGKSCIRLKKMQDIPFELIAKLMTKVSVQDYIDTYEKEFKK